MQFCVNSLMIMGALLTYIIQRIKWHKWVINQIFKIKALQDCFCITHVLFEVQIGSCVCGRDELPPNCSHFCFREYLQNLSVWERAFL